MKAKGTFRIFLKDGKILEIHNDWLTVGFRALLSHLGNLASAYTNGIRPNYLHYGYSDKTFNVSDYGLTGFIGSVIKTTATLVSSNVLRFDFTIPISGSALSISEIAVGVTASNPASATDYPNLVLDRAVLAEAIVKGTSETIPVEYILEFQP
jgi:hypothetical protein